MTKDEFLRHYAARIREDGDCLRWLGSCCNGHPAVRIDGKTVLVRRVLMQPGPGKIARCTCGTDDCINPEHLTVTTYRAVAKQLGALGVMSGPVRSARIAAVKRAGKQARITQETARAIRDSDETGRVLAARYGIAEATVSKIRLGQVRREFAGNPWRGLGA